MQGFRNNNQKSGTWKIELARTIDFLPSEDDNDEERVMYWKTDTIDIMISDEPDEVIKKIFDSLKNRYRNNLGS